jgi:hypothetical protein
MFFFFFSLINTALAVWNALSLLLAARGGGARYTFVSGRNPLQIPPGQQGTVVRPRPREAVCALKGEVAAVVKEEAEVVEDGVVARAPREELARGVKVAHLLAALFAFHLKIREIIRC